MTTPVLADRVYDLLNAKKPALASRFKNDFRSQAKDDVEQIKDLNNHFRIELSKIEMNTMQERSVLKDELKPEMWITYFSKYVLPTLVRFDSPSE